MKNDGHLVFKGQIKIISFEKTWKNIYNNNLAEIIIIVISWAKKTEKIWGFHYIFGSHFMFC